MATAPGPTTVQLLDIPPYNDADIGAGFYAGAYGTSSGWRGCALYRSFDSGTTYREVAKINTAAVMGSANDALATGTAGAWDVVNTVDVTVRGTLESSTEDEAFLCLLGNELLRFQDAALVSSRGAMTTYTLSNLLRGLYDTDTAVSTHVQGDRFVLLNSAVIRIPGNQEDIGASQLIKAVSYGQAIASAQALGFVNTGRGLYLARNKYLEIDVAGSDDVTLTDAQSWYAVLKLTGILTGDIDVIVPTRAREWIVWNATTGAYTLTVKTLSGTSEEITQGNNAVIFCDGTNVEALS